MIISLAGSWMQHNKILKMAITCLFLFFALSVSAKEDVPHKNDYVLIINTYSESAPWSNSIISPVILAISRDDKLDVFVEHIDMLLIDEQAGLSEFEAQIRTKYTAHPPKALLLLGNSSFLLRKKFKEFWGDIPILLCAEKDYIGHDSCYTKKEPIPVEEQIPLENFLEEYNLTVLKAPVYLQESVELMKRMIPDMNNLILIGDQTYINQQDSYDLSALMKRDYPKMGYRFFSAKDLTTDQLLDSLKAVNVQTTGVLFASWFSKMSFAGNTTLLTNSYRIIATMPTPLFVLKALALKEESGIVGGYIYNQDEYANKVVSTIYEVLRGKQARDIPFYSPTLKGPVFNYESLLLRNLSPDLCPSGTQFYKQPPTLLSEYRGPIIVTFICIFLILLLFQYRRIQMLKKLKKAQQRELDSVADYMNLFNNMPVLYMREEVILDEAGEPIDTVFVNVNTHFEKHFLPKDKALGKKGSELFPESLPEFLHYIKIVMAERRTINFPYYFKGLDTFYDIALNCSNQPGIIDIFCMDSTELHEVQQKLSSTNHKLSMALEVANIVPWKWDLQSHTILCDVNRPIELSIGEQEVDESQLVVPDTQYFAKICKDDRQRVQEAYDDLIAGKINKVREEYRVIAHADSGRKVDWVEAQAAIESWDDNGKPLTLVGSSLVITQRKNMEEELISAKNRAEESNRLKSAFLANMSHEIRTPLNAIVGFSGILASTEGEQEKQEYVSIIESNNNLLLQLINDILDLSKIEAGTLEFIYSDVELNGFLREMEDTLRMKMTSDKVTLICQQSMTDCCIYTEKNRLSQLIINLVTNAIKFTKEGSISCGYKQQDGMLYFHVTDTGCGIPQDKLKDVFGRFVKLNSFVQGTGLGLSICQTIVQNLGGEIGVESEEGKGSTFWFTIPYIPGKTIEQKVYDCAPISVEKSKLTILIAEDHSSNYKLFETILGHEYHLIHAWNGQEAVDLFEKHQPHLVLMDINMPVMDGYEATKEIRKVSTRVPIIAITAFAYASDEQRVLSNGFDGYMPKPINANQLKSKVIDILGKRIILI